MDSNKKTSRTIGWVLTVLVGGFMLFSCVMKNVDFPNKEAAMAKSEIALSMLPTLAIIELIVTILYFIPRTAFLGAILMTGYLGGAIYCHLRVSEPWFFPIIIGVVAWVALALRQPAIFRLALRGTT